MPEIKQICGTCRYWIPGEILRSGSLNIIKDHPICKTFKEVCYPEQFPKSWCWKVADPWDLETRAKKGFIEEG